MSFDPVETTDLYEKAVSYFDEPRWSNMILGLDRIKMLACLLGNPQNEYKVIHVAGTNGKGSVCACLESILRASGMKCGLFTSPYIDHFEESIQCDGQEISKHSLIEIYEEVSAQARIVEEQLGEHPTVFELKCAAAFLYFARSGCDVAVLETGLGGTFDATNIANPILSVITRIGLDHKNILGDTLAEIAINKAGIIKEGIPVVSWPQDTDSMKVIEETCKKLNAPLKVVDFSSLSYGKLDIETFTRSFSYARSNYQTSMIANYQIENASVAISSAQVLAESHFPQIDEETIYAGIKNAKWPGRFEVLGTSPLFIIDGAHNPQGAEGLLDSLSLFGVSKANRITIICGMLADKDCAEVLKTILPISKRFIAYTPSGSRAMCAENLAHLASSISKQSGECLSVEVASSYEDAVSLALEKESPEGCIVSFGTLYAISDIRKAYLGIKPLLD